MSLDTLIREATVLAGGAHPCAAGHLWESRGLELVTGRGEIKASDDLFE